jgi:hypothetical protein
MRSGPIGQVRGAIMAGRDPVNQGSPKIIRTLHPHTIFGAHLAGTFLARASNARRALWSLSKAPSLKPGNNDTGDSTHILKILRRSVDR